uniref:Uncharacterized protein n=1 Tax=viral metagenome TaxID=1070528 RepID=A0A6C0ADP2_9ZZZZ
MFFFIWDGEVKSLQKIIEKYISLKNLKSLQKIIEKIYFIKEFTKNYTTPSQINLSNLKKLYVYLYDF